MPATWEELVAALQPKRGKRASMTVSEERVAAALMLAKDPSLSATVACGKCCVPGFESRAGNLANTIKQFGMQDVPLPERWASAAADEAFDLSTLDGNLPLAPSSLPALSLIAVHHIQPTALPLTKYLIPGW